MKNTFAFILSFTVLAASAQPAEHQQAINAQVWKPFLESFNHFDGETFMSVHHPEALRVLEDDNRIQDFNTYAENTITWSKRGKESGQKRELTLRFTRRIADENNAFEVGFYRTRVTQPDGTVNNYYGKFHVVLKKHNGQWKIWLDADTAEGASEEAFLKAEPMEG